MTSYNVSAILVFLLLGSYLLLFFFFLYKSDSDIMRALISFVRTSDTWLTFTWLLYAYVDIE